MRVTGGALRGRVLQAPPIVGLRPTPAKVREALFNILGDVHARSMLELYAGSGIVALEALSRGMAHVTSVEANRRAMRHLREIRKSWRLESCWRLMPGRVQEVMQTLAGMRVDLVFADPPYAQGLAERLPALLDRYAIEAHWYVVEESSRVQPVWPEGWQCLQARRYGDTTLHFLQRQRSPS